MGKVLPITPANDDASLYEQFARRVVESTTSRGLPAAPVALALLSQSVNVLIAEDGAAPTAKFLGALAVRLAGMAGDGDER